MINRSPLELEPPSPMQPPPLRRSPFPMPQISIASAVASTAPFPAVFD
ncbi:hypothetical protein IMZ68_01475 [Candidatus Bathyarchaeota archaeon]|nr:hypothetical protein [Candidatus Bathyarchaeota archaeon]